MKVSNVSAYVETLQQQGVDVRFFHYRRVSDVSEKGPWILKRYYRNGKQDRDERPAHVNPMGGATCCLLTHPETGDKFYGVVVFERSVQHHPLAFPPREGQHTTKPCQFCYALGRAVALGRARQKMVPGNAPEPEGFEFPSDLGTVEITVEAV